MSACLVTLDVALKSEISVRLLLELKHRRQVLCMLQAQQQFLLLEVASPQ